MPTTIPYQKLYPTMFPEQAAPQPAPYGLRPDGTAKGKGYLGELKRPDGGVMTEYSVGVEIDGKEMDIPTLVPTLTKKEVETLLKLKVGKQPPKSIVDKAYDHAMKRLAEGKDVFAGPDESPAAKPAKQK